MAFHNRGTWIKAFQRMKLHRKYPPIVVRCVGFLFHDRILFSRAPLHCGKQAIPQGKTVAHFRLSGHLATLRIAKYVMRARVARKTRTLEGTFVNAFTQRQTALVECSRRLPRRGPRSFCPVIYM